MKEPGTTSNAGLETVAFQRFISTSAKPKRHRDRAAKEQALLEAATKLFARQGYEVTTTREIAASAGCAEGLIHRYFSGKAGLLLTMIQNRASAQVEDLNLRMPLASKFNDEFFRLVDWELERMWQDRDFLRVIIPRALVDSAFGSVLGQVSTSRHSEAIVQRLKKFKECKSLSLEELQGLARFVGLLGFGFGFLRPVALGQDRARAKNMAHSIAKILLRGI
jgi:AcrR family transcriptional regulator